MKVFTRAAIGCAAFMLSGFALGCATTDSSGGGAAPKGAAVAGPQSYSCAGGKTIRVEGAAGAQEMRLTLPDGQDAKLTAVEGAKVKSYSNGNVTLTFTGDGVNVTFFGGRAPLTGCVANR